MCALTHTHTQTICMTHDDEDEEFMGFCRQWCWFGFNSDQLRVGDIDSVFQVLLRHGKSSEILLNTWLYWIINMMPYYEYAEFRLLSFFIWYLSYLLFYYYCIPYVY